jgi:hypothetical protein
MAERFAQHIFPSSRPNRTLESLHPFTLFFGIDRFSQSKEAKFTLFNLNVLGAIRSDH